MTFEEKLEKRATECQVRADQECRGPFYSAHMSTGKWSREETVREILKFLREEKDESMSIAEAQALVLAILEIERRFLRDKQAP